MDSKLYAVVWAGIGLEFDDFLVVSTTNFLVP